jgi:CBS domain containing-hemolysin-like protein
MDASVLLRIFLLFLLVAVNAFFVAAEFALVSIRDTRVQQLVEQRRTGARTVHRLHQDLDSVLNGVQFGITIASLALGWVGEPALAVIIEALLGDIPHAAVYAHTLAIVIAFTIITYMHVILGEVVPKSVALQRAERVALAVAAPMDVFLTLAKPFLFIMNKSSEVVLRLFGSRQVRHGGVHSPEELKLIVTASRRSGLLPEFQESLILRALEVGNITVREIMVPRPAIFSLPADLPLSEAMVRVVQEQHSRVPVYDPQRGPEHIMGLLYSKDLMRWMRLRQSLPTGDSNLPRLDKMQVREIMRSVLVVPETKELPDLLLEFKQRKRHLAVVVDEFGSTAGVVTVEDVLEQLVGEIEDEFDVTQQPPLTLGAAMVLDGTIPIRDLETQYHLRLPREEGFETLAGFVFSKLQKIPAKGEWFEFEGRRYTVLEMDGHRLAKVKIEVAGPQTVEQSAG